MRWLDWLRGKSGLQSKRIGQTRLLFNPNHDAVVRDYYLYVVQLFADAARKAGPDADIVFGDYLVRKKSKRRLFRLAFQIEHVLVRPGGRGSLDAPPSTLMVLGHPEERYLVRLEGAKRLALADAIVDYSLPNLLHIRCSDAWSSLVLRMHYIAPLVYRLDEWPSIDGRDLSVVTLFGNPEEPRRKALLEQLVAWNSACRNISGKFSNVADIYRRTRILVNIRQTEHHHTLEELRVLPALLSGVVVVSEDVPLREEVPYHPFIVWANPGCVVDTVRDVHAHYEAYFERIFGGSALRDCLAHMQKSNLKQANDILKLFQISMTANNAPQHD